MDCSIYYLIISIHIRIDFSLTSCPSGPPPNHRQLSSSLQRLLYDPIQAMNCRFSQYKQSIQTNVVIGREGKRLLISSSCRFHARAFMDDKSSKHKLVLALLHPPPSRTEQRIWPSQQEQQQQLGIKHTHLLLVVKRNSPPPNKNDDNNNVGGKPEAHCPCGCCASPPNMSLNLWRLTGSQPASQVSRPAEWKQRISTRWSEFSLFATIDQNNNNNTHLILACILYITVINPASITLQNIVYLPYTYIYSTLHFIYIHIVYSLVISSCFTF